MKNRINEEYITNEGYLCKIIKYKNALSVDIQFENNIILYDKSYEAVKNGRIKNPYHRTLYNEGYIGIGLFTSWNNIQGSNFKNYKVWQSMIERCYSNKCITYKNVVVCEEWKCFQVFAKWFEENYVDGFHLDKDILTKGNKIYSPNTCTFVPKDINSLFTKRQNKRGNYLIGVSKHRAKYTALINIYGIQKNIGIFNSELEAFQAYKTAKEDYIKEVADKYRHQITKQCYQALYNYK